jgi:hypothetical protein
MTRPRFRHDILAVLLLGWAAGCDARPPLDNSSGLVNAGGGMPGAASGAGGTAGASSTTSGAAGVLGQVTGAGGIGSTTTGGGCGPTAFADPNGGSSGSCRADTGPYANVPKDPTDRCPCSRAIGRANPPEHRLCPPGSGAKMQATIGPGGGTLMLDTHAAQGSAFVLDVPPGALPMPTVLTVTELPGTTPIGYTDLTPLYVLEPVGLKLAARAKLSIPWNVVIASGFELRSPPETSIYESATQTGGYARLGDSYDNAGFSQGSIDTLGYLFVAYPASIDPASCSSAIPGGTI